MRNITLSLFFMGMVMLPGPIQSRIPLRDAPRDSLGGSVQVKPPIFMDIGSDVVPAGTIVPQPNVPETFSEKPSEILFRITNRSEKPVYIQGLHQEEDKVLLYFYHRDKGRGWKPFFPSLPCDLPTCRNLHSLKQDCTKPVPFVISLGPAGTFNSVEEFQWGGLLYQRIEAIRESRQRRYCYKGLVPQSGRMRIEVEFSEKTQNRTGKRGLIIGSRDHTALEIGLPPARDVYDIYVGK